MVFTDQFSPLHVEYMKFIYYNKNCFNANLTMKGKKYNDKIDKCTKRGMG